LRQNQCFSKLKMVTDFHHYTALYTSINKNECFFHLKTVIEGDNFYGKHFQLTEDNIANDVQPCT
jgi:hypothetical protein